MLLEWILWLVHNNILALLEWVACGLHESSLAVCGILWLDIQAQSRRQCSLAVGGILWLDILTQCGMQCLLPSAADFDLIYSKMWNDFIYSTCLQCVTNTSKPQIFVAYTSMTRVSSFEKGRNEKIMSWKKSKSMLALDICHDLRPRKIWVREVASNLYRNYICRGCTSIHDGLAI